MKRLHNLFNVYLAFSIQNINSYFQKKNKENDKLYQMLSFHPRPTRNIYLLTLVFNQT